MSTPAATTVAIDIANPLHCKPEEIGKYLQVKAGDTITQGMTLAVKSGFLGMEKITIQSPTDGLITGIDDEQGQLIVLLAGSKTVVSTPKEEEKFLPAPETHEAISAHVESKPPEAEQKHPEVPEPSSVSIPPVSQPLPEVPVPTQLEQEPASKPVELPADAKQIQGLYGFGEGKGVGWLIEHDFSDKSLIAQMKGKIVIIPTIPTVTQLYKASAIGIEGFISNANHDQIQTQTQKLQQEVNGKIRTAFLLLSDRVSLTTLHGKNLQVLGKELLLVIYPS